MTFVLTIILFLANGPVPIIGVFEDRSICGSAESAVITKAMSDARVAGYALVDDCKAVRADSKV